MKQRLLLFFSLALLLSGCHIGRFVIYNFAGINDYKKFPQKEITKKGEPFQYQEGPDSLYRKISELKISGEKFGTKGLSDYLSEETKTVAFIVIKNDSILFEEYYEGFDESSIVTSFSVVKSYVSAMVGIALEDGFIESVEDPITKYIPELMESDSRYHDIKIRHALNMRTGLKFDESTYTNPFSEIAKLYYGTDHLKLLLETEIEKAAGLSHEYQSINTQILAIVLERATGQQLASYFEEKIWQPLGMEYDASWNVDSKKNQTPKGFCCLNARARDFAKLGRLYLKNGNWEGNQIISQDWIDRSVKPNFENGCYQYQWYSEKSSLLDENGSIAHFADSLAAAGQIENDFQKAVASSRNKGQYYVNECGPAYMAVGILGQYIYVDPDKELVMVRFGKKADSSYPYLFKKIGELVAQSN
jgi:CubicO group peptidase (beta-lactamase class C family)